MSTRPRTGVGRPAVERAHRLSPPPSFELSESKLHAPVARPGIVPRTVLVERLIAADSPTVISVVAPPGYGKTTLLAQWANRKSPRLGWVSVDERDNDPAMLLSHLAVAIDRIEPIDPRVFRALASPGSTVAVPARLAAAVAAMGSPVAVVLDHVEAITNRECRDAIAMFALGLPAGSQLAIGSRDELPLPVARLRAQGSIVEIRVDDLTMTEVEAHSLLERAGIDLAEPDRLELVRRTEGWAVALYLAAVAVRAGGSPTGVGEVVTGDDRFIGDYLRSEILDRLADAEATFLTRTSILDRMCGPLCDAITDRRDSCTVLEELEAHNLLLVALDRRREWYRYHHLFRQLLASELRRREPDIATELHLRAAKWFEGNGLPETAIGHAQAAGDADRVTRLVLQRANPVWASGRGDTVLSWMEWFEANGLVSEYPGIAVHGALTFAMAGRPGATERWAGAAEQAPPTGTLADGNTVEGTVAYLRALLCRRGVDQMRRDAQIALNGLSPSSPYHAAMIHVEGLALLLEGDLERADALISRAVDAATSTGVVPFVAVLLAERGIVAIQREDWVSADACAQQALEIMDSGDLDDYWTSALVYAWVARAMLRRGDVTSGRRYVARAARLRPLLNYALPVVSVQALLEMARAYLALDDHGGARAVLRQAHDIFLQRPALGVLLEEADALQARLETTRVAVSGASSLTTAELRLLPLLPTHLSFREIGERLYLSRHTIKTQAISIYRKLGTSSRSETIRRMHELGLLEHA